MDSAIIEETLGQYIGQKDKNGKEIYDGDILKAILPDITIIGVVEFQKINCSFIIINEKGIDCSFFRNLKDLEVIGNIYDNPELLEKEGIKDEQCN